MSKERVENARRLLMDAFFEESTEQSQIKATIVANYFWAWANVILSSAKRQGKRDVRTQYVDLFAGPGRYSDGTKSTPLLVLEKAVIEPQLRNALVTLFNDANANHSRSLETAIDSLPGVATLRFAPRVFNYEVGDQIVSQFENTKLVPTLFFVDPWGYKGLSLRLVNSVLKDWGCDCIFFFNYNRINMGLPNAIVDVHIDSLFGSDRANELRGRLEGMPPQEREIAILEYLAKALQDLGGKYVLPFCFLNESGSRTSHYLIFVTKHVRGYEIMKDVMAKQSSKAAQGVPSFSYCPADRKYPLLFELARPLDDLEGMLLSEFAGQRLTMRAIFDRHHIGRAYLKRNYKDVLLKLERDGRIEADPPADQRKRNTFADMVIAIFP